MAIDKIDKKLSSIPLLRKRITVNPTIQADKDDFMDKYETTNDHLANITVTELNQIVDAIDNTTSQIDTTVTHIDTQTGIATTKATEANDSALSASASANIVLDNKTNIDIIGENITEITIAADNITGIDTVATSISDVLVVSEAIQSGSLGTVIDDNSISAITVWSSKKIADELDSKADKENPSFTGVVTGDEEASQPKHLTTLAMVQATALYF